MRTISEQSIWGRAYRHQIANLKIRSLPLPALIMPLILWGHLAPAGCSDGTFYVLIGELLLTERMLQKYSTGQFIFCWLELYNIPALDFG